MMSTVIPKFKVKNYSEERYLGCITTFKFEYNWTLENSKINRKHSVAVALGPFTTFANKHKFIWELSYNYNQEFNDKLILTLLNHDFYNNVEIRVNLKINFDTGVKLPLPEQRWDQINTVGKKFTKELPIETEHYMYRDAASMVIKIGINIMLKDSIMERNKLFDDLSTLLGSGEKSDIVFVVGKDEIKAHELILSTRSKVFAKMFKSDMLEKKTKKIQIKDIDSIIFKELLNFIYSEKEPDVEYTRLNELLIAAEKYEIDGLKTYCLKKMIENMNIDNAANMLISAELTDNIILKSRIINYILANKKEILNTEGYKNLTKSHAYLIVEMFQYLA